jgi:hypothetical protein
MQEPRNLFYHVLVFLNVSKVFLEISSLIIPVSLDLCVFEGLWIASSPDAKVVVSNRGVEVHSHVHILEVALFRRIPELPGTTLSVQITSGSTWPCSYS